MPIFLENFSPISCNKNFVSRFPLSLNYPCLMSISTSKNYNGWWKLDHFHNMNTCWKTHQKLASHSPPLPPSSDGWRPCSARKKNSLPL